LIHCFTGSPPIRPRRLVPHHRMSPTAFVSSIPPWGVIALSRPPVVGPFLSLLSCNFPFFCCFVSFLPLPPHGKGLEGPFFFSKVEVRPRCFDVCLFQSIVVPPSPTEFVPWVSPFFPRALIETGLFFFLGRRRFHCTGGFPVPTSAPPLVLRWPLDFFFISSYSRIVVFGADLETRCPVNLTRYPPSPSPLVVERVRSAVFFFSVVAVGDSVKSRFACFFEVTKIKHAALLGLFPRFLSPLSSRVVVSSLPPPRHVSDQHYPFLRPGMGLAL